MIDYYPWREKASAWMRDQLFRRGITQTELATQMRISNATVSRYLRYRTNYPEGFVYRFRIALVVIEAMKRQAWENGGKAKCDAEISAWLEQRRAQDAAKTKRVPKRNEGPAPP